MVQQKLNTLFPVSLLAFSLPLWDSLSKWERVDLFGLALVAVGVLGEAVLIVWSILLPYNPTNFPPLESILGFRKKHLEIFFGAIVAIGVAIELRALPASLGESHKMISELESNMASTIHSNLVLSTELQKLKNPRMVSPEQYKKFIELSKGLPGIHIRVFSPSGDNEAYRYAFQIRQMLDAAGFSANGEQVNEVIGYVRERPESSAPFRDYDVGCFWYNTNKNAFLFLFDKNTVPKFIDGKRILVETSPPAIFAVVVWQFNQIKITTSGTPDDTLLKPGEFGVFVPPKNH